MNDQSPCPRILLPAGASWSEKAGWLDFVDPVETLIANRPVDVIPVLEQAESATNQGLHAAGFVTYEAASSFDAALVTKPPGPLPLAWFGLFREPARHERLPFDIGTSELRAWRPSVDLEEYRRAIREIRSAIARGETYQANFTFRIRGRFSGQPSALFSRLTATQRRARHAAFIDLGDHAICSASPELFFSLSGSRITCRPMKGTAHRGLTAESDRRMALALYDSTKNRAENLMIVDMIRNDLGRVAVPGSVQVLSLFDLERYDSVHQLTSTIEAESDRSMAEIFAALFPCASITGAPKVSTMRLLTALETAPRGIYTGAIGHFAPGRRAEFSVAIRTVHVDRQQETAEFGTGGGIVWDSNADEEYRECATKASVLTFELPAFELLETIRWEPSAGFTLLDRHLDRLEASADYFGFPCDRPQIQNALAHAVPTSDSGPQHLRLLLGNDGTPRVEHRGAVTSLDRPWRLAVCPGPVASDDLFLYHKTSYRDVYRRAREATADHDDVLLWNEHGCLTESTIANLVVEIDGRRLTPPVDDGLLAGTLRQALLEQGELEIGSLAVDDLSRATKIWLVNSVRNWISVDEVDDLRPGRELALWRNTCQ